MFICMSRLICVCVCVCVRVCVCVCVFQFSFLPFIFRSRAMQALEFPHLKPLSLFPTFFLMDRVEGVFISRQPGPAVEGDGGCQGAACQVCAWWLCGYFTFTAALLPLYFCFTVVEGHGWLMRCSMSGRWYRM